MAGQLGLSARLRGGLGNWRNATDKDARDESVSMAIRYDASKTQANLQAKLMYACALQQAVTKKVDSYNFALGELTPHFPALADLEKWAIARVTDVVPQEGDAASRLKSIKVKETPSMVKAALTRLLGSPQEAAKAADSNDEGDSESDGTAHSDDEAAGPLALRVGGTIMFYTNKMKSAPIHLLNEETSDGQYCYGAKSCNAQVAFQNATRDAAWRMLSVQRQFCPKCRVLGVLTFARFYSRLALDALTLRHWSRGPIAKRMQKYAPRAPITATSSRSACTRSYHWVCLRLRASVPLRRARTRARVLSFVCRGYWGPGS